MIYLINKLHERHAQLNVWTKRIVLCKRTETARVVRSTAARARMDSANLLEKYSLVTGSM